MRDYASYFIERKTSAKSGVSVHHDLDWWVAHIAGRAAKSLFIVLLLLTVYTLWLLWHAGHDKNIFPVSNIDVNGEVLITQPQDIKTLLQPLQSMSFFDVDIDQLKHDITALPWVESVTVKRQWPDTLQVAMVERQARYRWGDTELVDEAGNRFDKVDDTLFEDLPVIHGVDGSESRVILAYEQLSSELGGSMEQLGVESLVLNQYLSWELHLHDGLVVKFGRDDYTQRMKRFVQAFHTGKLPEFAQLEVLDFRYYRGFAVKWKAEHLPQSAAQHLVKVSETKI